MKGRRAPRSQSGIPLGSLFGIRIVADFSLAIIFALVTVNLGLGVLPDWHPEWSAVMVWSVALGAAVLFFASILAHELSHALVGRVFGIPVRRITLFIFGGMAHTEREPPSPKSELLMAAAGPIASIGIGVAATVGGVWLAGPAFAGAEDPMRALARVGPIATLLLWLGPVNVLLGVFNLVPGFPLDGGRVLRAVLWAMTRDLEKATRWASWGGQLVAWLLIALGVTSLFSGGLLQGLWLALIGWFLLNAARVSYQQTVVHEALRDTRVGEVMRRGLAEVAPQLSVATLVSQYVMTTDQHGFPVVDAGRLVGIVSLDDVRAVPEAAWSTTTIGQIMTPREALETVRADEPAIEALRKLGERDVEQVPVVEKDGSLLGLVRRQDILRWLRIHGAAELPA